MVNRPYICTFDNDGLSYSGTKHAALIVTATCSISVRQNFNARCGQEEVPKRIDVHRPAPASTLLNLFILLKQAMRKTNFKRKFFFFELYKHEIMTTPKLQLIKKTQQFVIPAFSSFIDAIRRRISDWQEKKSYFDSFNRLRVVQIQTHKM